ncbi:uncharacterized protein CEXT_565571 [Caerostris extrusa]|uniref:Uncharacterized protein n=1 Tax=Caerostris extrusa TaxID=172846 RepID=A0AAV4M9P3_CAEEX|nr:uncharacterized protein CEXT_565571 [Caerostris extrusa]
MLMGNQDGVIIYIERLNILAGCNSSEYVTFQSKNKTITYCEKNSNEDNMSGSIYFYAASVELLYATKTDITTSVEMIVTPFQRGPCTSNIHFMCTNYMCILKTLICDNRNNCGDFSDEQSIFINTQCETFSVTEISSFIPLFISLPLLLLCITLILYCCIKRQSDKSEGGTGEVLYAYEENDPIRTVPKELSAPILKIS